MKKDIMQYVSINIRLSFEEFHTKIKPIHETLGKTYRDMLLEGAEHFKLVESPTTITED